MIQAYRDVTHGVASSGRSHMRILIAGAGTIGTNLASALVSEGQDVVAVDTNEHALAQLSAGVDCQTVHASALSPLVMEDLGIRHTDLVVAVTRDDATNMSVCRLADFYHVPRKLARVRNPEYTERDCPVPPEHFGIDYIISPEGIAVDHIARLIACPGAREAVDFEQGRIALRALPVTEDSRFAGEQLLTVRQSLDAEFLIAAIKRGPKVTIPGGKETLRIGDTVYLVSAPEALDVLVPTFVPHARTATRVIIFGGEITGILLARRLAPTLDSLTLIEPDRRTAERAAEILDPLGVEVLHGDALDDALITRCHADRTDFFVALSEDEEENFMSALLFRKYSNGTPIVLTNKQHYTDILQSVDLDIVINPRALAAAALMRHIRGNTVLSVARLSSEEAEALEFKAHRQCHVTRKPLRDLKLPAGMLIAAVMRGGDLHIPSGDFQIAEGDRVLVFADERADSHVEHLFQ